MGHSGLAGAQQVGHLGSLSDFGRDDVAVVGGKAANLGELVRAGFPVPAGFVVKTGAYREFVTRQGLADDIAALVPTAADAEAEAYAGAERQIAAIFARVEFPADLREEVATAYVQLGEPAVAVRSSATAEDLAEASFAGQQDTYLNIRGLPALVTAIQSCWASLWTARAMAYRARQGIDPAGVNLAVVVQTLVDADAAGVMFTANPVNGRTTEVLIAAAFGLGEAIVSGSVNTDQIVVAKTDRAITARETADKAVMTVRTAEGTTEVPVSPERREQPVLDDPSAVELAELGIRIEQHYGAPQDIEWARAGTELFIVQSRAITALPPAEAEPPTDWSVPNPKGMYVRASMVEQLPDPLSPLFADLVDGAVTHSLRTLMSELLGRDVIRDGDVAMPTVNGYAYYYYSRSGMVRMSLHSGKAVRSLGNNPKYNSRLRWRNYSLPRYQAAVARWSARNPADLTNAELMAGVVELLDAGAEYYTSVQTIIPVAVTSEVVFTRFYDRFVRRSGDPAAATFLLGFDSLPIQAEKSLYDLGRWIAQVPELAQAWSESSTDDLLRRLRSDGSGESDGAGWAELRERLQAHLDRFGHTVYNLDFVYPVPADDPAPLIDTLRYYVGGESADPYERQRRSARVRQDSTGAVLGRLGPIRGRVFTRLLHWAQQVAPIREDALGDLGLAWPRLRQLAAELGRRLVAAGVLDSADDVYWLHWAEIGAALNVEPPATSPVGSEPLRSLDDRVRARRELWRGQRRVTPPQLLPADSWLRIFTSFLPANGGDQGGNVLKGIGASAGRVTAIARVLDGPEDFGRLQPGEILVANITTPAWTSLFARASGIVTDVGGPLSHSSIVAREYGIPAVLGTAVASKRIADGQRVTVDGDAGTVMLASTDD